MLQCPIDRHQSRLNRALVARPTSAQGQQRKSSVSLKMSLVGGKAEVDFGRLKVRLVPIVLQKSVEILSEQ